MPTRTVVILGMLLAMATTVSAAGRGQKHHRFEDPFKYTAQWDHPERNAWQRPSAVS